MAFNAGAGFEMNAGFYGCFAASLHGQSHFHSGYDVIIR